MTRYLDRISVSAVFPPVALPAVLPCRPSCPGVAAPGRSRIAGTDGDTASDNGQVIDADDVRRVALSLPETMEKPSYGTPGFRVKDKLFARIREEGDILVVWCSDEGEKQALVASEPEKFFTTPHYDGYPMVLARFAAIDVGELTELLTESWRCRAPRRLVTTFDNRQA